ncbi:MAG: EamA family transporter [Clostridiales bacterium]|nr:EamA family transporter [Clostridiales bacterium]
MTNPSPQPAAASSRLMLLVAVLAFGTVGLLVRGIALPSHEVALYRAAIALVVLSLIMARTGRFALLRVHRAQLGRYALSGAVMACNWILLFEAYRHTSIALATLAYYAAPTLMVLAGVLLLRERLSAWQLLCFAASTLGLVLMLGASGGQPGDVKGALLGLASAVLYATVITLNRASGAVDGILRTFVQFLAAVLVLLPFTWLRGGFHLGALSPRGWVWLVTLGLVHTGICYSMYFTAIPRLPGLQVAIMSYLDPLVAVLLSVLLLGEAISPLQLVGGVILLLGALLMDWPRLVKRPVRPGA